MNLELGGRGEDSHAFVIYSASSHHLLRSSGVALFEQSPSMGSIRCFYLFGCLEGEGYRPLAA